MVIKVCDAICGAGKTQGCISMMNEQTDKKFIFVTPYLTEVERIKKDCSSRRFLSPERGMSNGSSSKLQNLNELLLKGRNIATTHALFSYYTDETKTLIKQGGYTLVLDEVLNLFQPVGLNNQDMDILVKSNTLFAEDTGNTDNASEYVWGDEDYEGDCFNEVMLKSKSNNLIKYKNELYFWSIPPDIFECFDDVYILTYMFQYQMQKYFFDVYGFKYELIGTKKDEIGDKYHFCKFEEADRKRDLRGLIHILDNPNLNSIGDDTSALSFTWYSKALAEKDRPKLTILKNNLYNLFTNIYKCNSTQNMWSTFKDYKSLLKGKGYSKNFIAYNKRATNEYRDRQYAAYMINCYMQTWAKNYLAEKGAKDVSENMYAISTLIQWLFRSAIRDGKEVWLYLPSRRMRNLFKQWLDNLANGEDLKVVRYEHHKKSSLKNELIKNNFTKGDLKNVRRLQFKI